MSAAGKDGATNGNGNDSVESAFDMSSSEEEDPHEVRKILIT